MTAAAPSVVIVGGGHNGLVAAALLARAGRRVRLFERADRLGGSLGTEELHPGYRAPVAFAGLERFHPAITRALDLERHGLRFMPQHGGTSVLLPDRGAVVLDPAGDTGAALARHSTRDAEALRSFEEERRRLAAALEPLLIAPLPRFAGSLTETAYDLLLAAKTWRGLGRAGLSDALRLLPMNLRDVLDERFESDVVKAAIAGPALLGSWMGPRSAGSMWNLLWQRPAWVSHLLAPPLHAAGGPGALVDALARAAAAAGVELRTAAPVARIRVGGGVVRGVTLASGEEVDAGQVVSTVGPKRTLLELLDAAAIDAETAVETAALRGRGNVAIARLALDRLPRFGGSATAGVLAGVSGVLAGVSGVLAGRVQLGATLDDLERAYDACKYGRVPDRPLVELVLPSVADPALAPAGGAVLHAWVQFVPSRPAAGQPDVRSAVERSLVGALEEHDPGFAASILHVDVATPNDLERRFGLDGGCLDHLEPALDQQLWLRPLLGWHLHSTPIHGLYLSGPGTHPGGGPTGLPGRCAAERLLAGPSGR